MNHPFTEQSVQAYRESGASIGTAAELATADAVHRLADIANNIWLTTERIAQSAGVAGRLLSDPLAFVTMARQIEMIDNNLEKADEAHRGRIAKDDFERALNMPNREDL